MNHRISHHSGSHAASLSEELTSPPPPPSSKAPSANGLIRLSLKKPMGIVFEPMDDPHNAAQQRGVRICELPRTGAAAMSNLLQVGDELLSINNKPMARLTFDEIMDFIIDIDPGNVDLLFRRPKKEKMPPRTSSQVKWDSNVVQTEHVPIVEDDEGTLDDTVDDTVEDKRYSPRKGRGYNSREDESVLSQDDTFYTEQTSYTEDTRDRKKRGKHRNRRYEAESFLDLLIDTMCAPVIGRDNGRGYNSDDDMTYDDEMTYDEDDYTFLQMKKKKWQESRKRRTEKDRKMAAEEERRSRSSKSKEIPKTKKSSSSEKYERNENPPLYDHTYSAEDEYGNKNNQMQYAEQNKPVPLHVPLGSPQGSNPGKASSRFSPMGAVNAPPNEHHSSKDDSAPFKEIAYDDQDDGAEVSVMESVGGPSLLLENLRNAQSIQKTVDPELIAVYGKDFKPEMGLTREESIHLYPLKFYKHAVVKLLNQYEPEKVQLVDKLFAKYEGREEHLIHKLKSRYSDHNAEPSKDETVEATSKSADGFNDFIPFNDFNSSNLEGDDNDNAWTHKEPLAFQTSNDKSNIDENASNESGSVSEGSDDSGDYDSIDGTSPEVIAQVSELLNYVYGKTSVAGQIDRVSTIMRAYEGRESILIELLETKALMKTNNEEGGHENLPEYLQNSPALQSNPNEPLVPPVSPKLNDDVAPNTPKSPMVNISNTLNEGAFNPNDSIGNEQNIEFNGKKKKGLFKKMFSKRENKSGKGAFPSDNRAKVATKGKQLY
jgi:hypothetical protein